MRTSFKSCCLAGSGNRVDLIMRKAKSSRTLCPAKPLKSQNVNHLHLTTHWPCQDRGVWYYRKLFNYLQYYAVDAYEDFEGEESFDFDGVDITTVHQAKGLEWPVVFMPSL